MKDSNDQVSIHLRDMAQGDEEAIRRLLPCIYDDLRALARGMYRRNPADNTLQATALVHEAYFRLVRPDAREYESRQHFMRVAAIAMRQLLTDYARERRRLKRGGGQKREELHDSIEIGADSEMQVELIDLDEALTEFSERYPRQARIVELRFFTGLSVEETAQILEVSPRTAKADWQLARAWLSRALADGSGPDTAPDSRI